MLAILGLLLVIFRQIERWLHQHIFKVGWLLSNNFQSATVLYYILFLPGILLHEITLWLAASILRVRAERAIGFPAQQEIGELRLNFIRLSPGSGRFRYSLAKLAPIGAGLLCLWLIAAQVFDWQAVAASAASGSIDDFARAITELSRTADFWLWFYLAFTVANTMFPAPRQRLSRGYKSALALGAGVLILVLWRLGGAAFISRSLESLIFSLVLIMLQTIAINLAVVLVLGALEAAIERVTGKSAAFRDGKMITMSRAEAQALKVKQERERLALRRKAQSKVKARTIASIYDSKLPIPGPPGKEPVSRNVVSVINVAAGKAEGAPGSEAKAERANLPPKEARQGKRPPKEPQAPAIISSAAPASEVKIIEPAQTARTAIEDAGKLETAYEENAPFSRPFAAEKDSKPKDKAGSDSVRASDAYFSRPFAMDRRADSEPASSELSAADSRAEARPAAEVSPGAQRPEPPMRKTKPAPKPSAKLKRDQESAPRLNEDELTYEALDDEDIYFADDEA